MNRIFALLFIVMTSTSFASSGGEESSKGMFSFLNGNKGKGKSKQDFKTIEYQTFFGTDYLNPGKLNIIPNEETRKVTLDWRGKSANKFNGSEFLLDQYLSASNFEFTHKKLIEPRRIPFFTNGYNDFGIIELNEQRYYIMFTTTGQIFKLEYEMNPNKGHSPIEQVTVKQLGEDEFLVHYSTVEDSSVLSNIYHYKKDKQTRYELSEVIQYDDLTLENVQSKSHSVKEIKTTRTRYFKHYDLNGETPVISDYIDIQSIPDYLRPSKQTMAYFPEKFKSNSLKEIRESTQKIAQELNSVFIERERAVEKVVNAVKEIGIAGRSSAENIKTNRFITLLGGTGTGKTDLAEVLADVAYDGRMIKFELSSMTESHHVNNIVGSATGYKGSDEPTQFEAYKEKHGDRPLVIILDEIEKAHKDVQNVFLPLVDGKGKISIKGKTLDFSNAIVIATTNKGAEVISPPGKQYSKEQLAERESHFTDSKGRDLLRKSDKVSKGLSAELVGRMDTVIPLSPISTEGAESILRKEVTTVLDAHQFDNGLKINFDDSIFEIVVRKNFKSEEGTRKIKATVNGVIDNAIGVAFDELEYDEGDELSIKNIEKNGREYIEITNVTDSRSKTIDYPTLKPEHKNPLHNKEAAKFLANLEDELGKHVFGQEEAIHRIAEAIRARAANPDIARAISVILLGTTGVGKTELAKALSISYFGSSDKLERIDFSKVTNEEQMNHMIYGDERFPDKPSRFQEILMANPEGAVILADEVGNVGYKDIYGKNNVKTGILQAFYPVIDEQFISLPDGTKADLSKFVIFQTSNDGEEHYANAPSDDERLAVYNQVKSREDVEKIMKDNGFSEALIGRYDEAVNMKPLIHDTREKILKLFIGKTEVSFKTHGKFKAVKLEKNFSSIASDIFYTHEKGGRSLRKFAESTLSSEIGKFAVELSQKINLEGSTVSLGVKDNYYGKWFYEGSSPEEREVVLSLKFKVGKKTFTKEINVTEGVPKHRLVNMDEITQISFHEAGHAILNSEEFTGMKLRIITVKGKGGYLGYAGYSPTDAKFLSSREDLVILVAKMIAGREAERMFFQDYLGYDFTANPELEEKILNGGFSGDYKQIREKVVRAISVGGMTKDYTKIPLDKEGNVLIEHKITQAEIERILNEGKAYARKMVNDPTNKKVIESIARELIESGSIEGDNVIKYVKDVNVLMGKKCNGLFDAFKKGSK